LLWRFVLKPWSVHNIGAPQANTPAFTLPIISMTQSADLFSRLVNWFSASGSDKAPINRPEHKRDLFSKLMNKVSG